MRQPTIKPLILLTTLLLMSLTWPIWLIRQRLPGEPSASVIVLRTFTDLSANELPSGGLGMNDQPAAKPESVISTGLVKPLIAANAAHSTPLPDVRALKHPHGKTVCSSSCMLSDHPTSSLTRADFERLISEYAQEPIPQGGPALDQLCYFSTQANKYLQETPSAKLDQRHRKFLQDELGKNVCVIEYRVITEAGIVRVWMPPTKVPLDIRYVFDMETNQIEKPITTSGTVKRTSLHHLWQRI